MTSALLFCRLGPRTSTQLIAAQAGAPWQLGYFSRSVEYFRTRRAQLKEERSSTTQSRLDLSTRSPLTRTAPSGVNRTPFPPETRLRGGRFVIFEVLGSGGEGIVYRALDSLRGEVIAIKVLHLEDDAAIPQLKREFRFLRDLVHPNLLRLYELVVERELSFFTMAYVEGKDFLASATSRPVLSSLILQLADVLKFLHQTGRVHRDVKPSNILVRETGELVLLDFGIGLDLRAKNQVDHAMMGTPRYMAPEVLAMRGASEKSDAYSLGILLYEALVGRHPQKSERTQLGQQEPFDPRDVDPTVPERFAHLVRVWTEPDPLRRGGVDACRELLDGPVSSPGVLSSLPPAWPLAFSGRRSELSRLLAAKEWVKEGYSPFIVRIEASSGMGKSSLLQQFLQDQDDAVVLLGRCSEHELVAHKAIDGVVVDLVNHLRQKSRDEQLEFVSEKDASILVQLFPEFALLDILHGAPQEEELRGDYRAMRLRSYAALAAVLHRLAEQETLVVAIDDLQWGDVDSGKLISEVFFGPERPNCLLLLSYRKEEKDKSECFQEIARRRLSVSSEVPEAVIELGALSDRESRELVETILSDNGATPSETTVEGIVNEAGGSPLLLTEMAAHVSIEADLRLGGGQGEIVRSIMESRLRTVSSSAQEAFALLCCSGGLTDVALLAELSGGSGESLVRELEQARLGRVRKGRMKLEPLHDAIRESQILVLGQHAADYHRKLAECLVQREGDAAQIARHFFACSDPRTSEWAEVAADAAARAFATAAAVELYRLALKTEGGIPARVFRLKRRLADTLADSGRGAEAAPLYEELAEQMSLDEGIELRGRAAEQFLITGEAKHGSRVLAAVHQQVGLTWPKSNARALSALLYHRGRLAILSDAAIDRAITMQKPETASRKLTACRAAWPIAIISTIHGAANSSLYLRLALQSGKRDALSVACAMEAIYHAVAGPRAAGKVDKWLDYSRRAAPGPEDTYCRAFSFFAEGQKHYLQGALEASIPLFIQAEELFLQHGRGVAWELNSARIFWSDALFYLGRHRELDALIETWIADAEERGDRYILSALKMAKVPRTLYREGDLRGAQLELAEGCALWDSPYVSYHDLSQAVIRAYIDVYRGAAAEALPQMGRLRTLMRKSYMDQVHVARVQVGAIEAVVHLEAAADAPTSEKKGLLKRVHQIARALLKEEATWSTALGLQFEALARLSVAPAEEDIAQLLEAERLFRLSGMNLHAAGASARAFELVGGEEGRDGLDQAHRSFLDADVGDWVAALSCITPRVLAR